MKLIALFVFTSLCSCLFAQESEIPSDSSKTTYLTEITFAANKWEQNIIEIPSRIAFVHRDAITFHNPQTAADLLTLSNNVFVQKSQLGGGSPMIRGFATNRVLLVIDGVRLNNAIFRSGNVQNVISLDAHAIQSAEVLLGPGSVMYGSDAIGGVIDFHTLEPTFSMGDKSFVNGSSLVRYSTVNKEKTVHADVNFGFKEVAFLTSVTRSSYNDLIMGTRGPEEYTRPDYIATLNGKDTVLVNPNENLQRFTGYDQWNVMQKIAFRPFQNVRVTYAGHFSQTSDYPRYDRLILRDEENRLANAEWYYGPQKWQLHSLSASSTSHTKFFDHVKTIFAFQHFGESRHNRNFGSAFRNDRRENVNAFSLNLDLEKRLSQKVALLYGLEGVTNKVYSHARCTNVLTQESSPLSTRYPNNSDWRSAALYAALKIHKGEQWKFNFSARFTSSYTFARFDTAFFKFPFTEASNLNHAVNASAGFVYNRNPSSKVYMNLSSGFRAPNIDDTGKVFDSEPGYVVVPNPGLKPEYAYNIEVGFIKSITGSLMIDGATYYTILDNALARGSFAFAGKDSIVYDNTLSKVVALKNINNAWVSGIELAMEYDLTKSFQARLSLNYQKGREKNDETQENYSPTHVPPVFGSLHCLYRNKFFKIDLYSNYNGRISYDNLELSERADAHLYAKDLYGKPYSPSWWTLNVKSSYTFKRLVTLDAGIENFFNKRYRPYSSGISAPGRNIIFSIKSRF